MTRLHSWAWLQGHTGYSRDTLLQLQGEAPRLYKPFDVRSGSGKWRHIDNPFGALKRAQKRVKRLLCDELEVHPALHGGVRGRSTLTAAEDHVHQHCLVGIDISNYFPSVTSRSVYQFFLRDLRCTPDVARCLTGLTTHGGHLPHGAPTSTIIANLLNQTLFDVLCRIADEHRCTLTVYVDDVFFSGRDARSCIGPVISALHRFGYRTSNKKKRVMPRSGEQVMLGLSVGGGISLPSDKLKTIGDAINAVEASRTTSPRGLDRLRRQIAYVKRFAPDQAAHLSERLAAAEDAAIVVLDGVAGPPDRHPCDLLSCRANRSHVVGSVAP